MTEKVLIKIQIFLSYVCYIVILFIWESIFYKKRKYLFWLYIFLVHGAFLD